MSNSWNRPKTQPSAEASPFKQLFTISQKQLSRANSKNKSLGSKMLSQRGSFSKKRILSNNLAVDRTVREQNIRLISKLMQISHRRIKPLMNEPFFVPKKMENPEREREIKLENQRLGKSLIKIKSGKSVEKIKIEIAKNIAKMQRKKQKLLAQKLQGGSRAVTESNDQAPKEYSEILQLSKTHNLSSSKRLSRTSNIRVTQLNDIKKTII